MTGAAGEGALLPLSDAERRAVEHRSLPLESEADIIEAFHRLSYDSARRGLSWHAARFRGRPVYKWPGDLWNYQELVWRLKPATILETGTADGGSALFYACLLDWQASEDRRHRHGTVVTIDIRPMSPHYPAHERIIYVPGFSSVDWPPKSGLDAGGLTIQVPPQLHPPVLVVLDSDHSRDHVLRELDVYGPLVSPGSYLVVEDTNVNGHPVLHEHGPGPAEAVAEWLPRHPEFREDRALPRSFLFSYHTWLRRLP